MGRPCPMDGRGHVHRSHGILTAQDGTGLRHHHGRATTMPKYHYIVKITTAPSPLNPGDYVKFHSIDTGHVGSVDWLDTAQMTSWLPGTGTVAVGDVIGITLTPAHAIAQGFDPEGDRKVPSHLPGAFAYDAHEVELLTVTAWLQHPTAGTHAFQLGDEVTLAHARPVEGVRARASFRPDIADRLGDAADDPWTVRWRTGTARARTAEGWSAPRPLTLSGELRGPEGAPCLPGERGWANVHVAAGFGPGA